MVSAERPRYTGRSPHGSDGRYRWELANLGRACPVCKAANTKRAADLRERARKAANERVLTAAGVSGNTGLDPADLPDIGPIEAEVIRDLAALIGPGVGTQRALARALAREIDSLTSRQAIAPLAKQLVQVMGSLIAPVPAVLDDYDLFIQELQEPLAVEDDAALDPWSAEQFRKARGTT